MTTTIKTEHAGAKNGGGYWGKREEAKMISKRRDADKQEARVDAEPETGWHVRPPA